MAEENPTETRTIGEPSDEQFQEIVKDLRQHPKYNAEWEQALSGNDDMDAFDALRVTATMSGELLTGPDDDWGSVCIVEDWNGVCMPPLPLSEMMAAGMPKELIARQLLPGIAHVSNAKRVLLGLSTWTISGDRLPELEGLISEHPDRTEALVLMEITADGVQRMSMAPILRDGTMGPRLGEWKDSDKPERSDGLFVDALVPALQLVRTLREQS